MADYIKDPAAVLDYVFNWSQWLASGETITTSTMTASTGLTVNSSTNTTISATAWVSGGTASRVYELTNKIVTNQGRTDERTITIRCQHR